MWQQSSKAQGEGTAASAEIYPRPLLQGGFMTQCCCNQLQELLGLWARDQAAAHSSNDIDWVYPIRLIGLTGLIGLNRLIRPIKFDWIDWVVSYHFSFRSRLPR